MLNQFIKASVHNKLLVFVCTIGLIIWGTYSLFHLKLDAIPDITNQQVVVVSQSPNLSAIEMEQFVTYPVEMAMQNIPGLDNVRSVSQFGLSIVTLEFKENIDLYFARNQVNERLQDVREEIPNGFARPAMLPVTTGLGEIFQYILKVNKDAEKNYSLSDLRTMQDWVVKKQLLGTAGVAEISSFGGYLKQYHVKVDANKLRSTNTTLSEVFNAVEKSNGNTGAGYIEKESQNYFIRGIGLAENMKDIENTFIKSYGGLSVKVSDVAIVEESHALRYGALTRSEGEAVGGIILMLKGENSREVIDNVKERFVKIQKGLPKGVVIEPFLDREMLINRTISTVSKNLLEGGIIVIFVLVLLLGHLRAGLIVASVIPLSMLFAIGMMVAFDVSGNLMSLGAIDFGLIVDGAVIIVENIVRRLSLQSDDNKEVVVEKATKQMVQSSIFGQAIILIVYLPLLMLSGIEGKMFRPMALTVIFALLGAVILSLTYVPAMSAMFLKAEKAHHKTFADRIMDKIEAFYRPILDTVLQYKKLTIAIGVAMLVAAIALFRTLGAEFIPQLDEGDFVIEVRMLPGTSLTQMINSSLVISKRLEAHFPDEIIACTGKIGTSEVPLDPMSIEEMDLVISMKDRDLWKKAHTKDEFIKLLEEQLSAVPGVFTSVQQPIAMRFNELMTGSKTDVIVKVLGGDLEQLSQIGNKIVKVVNTVDGAKDVSVAKAEGLPQLFVTYNREALNRYQISIEKMNEVLQTAIAGRKAGMLYETSMRFEIIVKIQHNANMDLDEIGNLIVHNEAGLAIPLKQLATLEVKEGPMAVFRENAERCVNVNLNVRGRDVQSVVADIEQKMEKEIALPVGYRVTYGGQFENLINAQNRLKMVVPLALGLILLMLYLSFNSLKNSLIVFSAIPFAIIGGVFALWLRDLPFSISAAVGFIALFGVAVLNGMVLVGYFEELKNEGITNPYERIRTGATTRLRPVIMTAMVASLGFLPMAISNGAGAEVQRPLATVVIGGLVSSTLLTLLLLPVFYATFTREKRASVQKMVSLLGFILISNVVFSQNITEPQAIEKALQYHPLLQQKQIAIQQSQLAVKGAKNFSMPELYVQFPTVGEFGVMQSFENPKVYKTSRLVAEKQVNVRQVQYQISEKDITHQTRLYYQNALYAKAKRDFYQLQDSLFNNYRKIASVEFQAGEISAISRMNIEAQSNSFHQSFLQEALAYQATKKQLSYWLGLENPNFDLQERFQALVLDSALLVKERLPQLNLYLKEKELAELNTQLLKQKTGLGYTLGITNQQGVTSKSAFDLRPNLRVGVLLPIWKKQYQAQIQAASLDKEIAQKGYETTLFEMENTFQQAYLSYQKQQANIQYFQQTALKQANEIRIAANKSFKLGELTAFEYLQSIKQANEIELSYMDAIFQYNLAVLQLGYFK